MKQLKLCLSSAALSESVTCGGWNPGPVYTPLFSKQCIREKPLKKMQKKKMPTCFHLLPLSYHQYSHLSLPTQTWYRTPSPTGEQWLYYPLGLIFLTTTKGQREVLVNPPSTPCC